MKNSSLHVISNTSDDSYAQSALPGTDLPEMATIQSELILRVIGQKAVNKDTAKSDLSALYGILGGLAQKTVMTVFALGKILSFIKEEIPHGEFVNFIEAQCPFDVRSAQRYMRVYECYKDYPKKQLEEMALSQAYTEAGIKKLAAPPKAAGDEEKDNDDTPDYGLPKVEEYSRLFKTPPVSGVRLARYRVFSVEDGKIHALNEALGIYPVAELHLPRHLDKPDARLAFEQAHKDVCIALEVYYARIEQLEDAGLLHKPEERRIAAIMQKQRGITDMPEQPKKKAKRSRK